MRTIGVISRGIRAPIIRQGDDLAAIVTESILSAAADGCRVAEQVCLAIAREG